MKQKRPIRDAAFCGLLLAALAVPVHAFADSPLAKLYNTDTSQPRSSDRFPRARYQDSFGKYIWGDMQLDVRPGETIECQAQVSTTAATCFYTPSSVVFDFPPPSPLTSSKKQLDAYVKENNIGDKGLLYKSPSKPDSVKVGFRVDTNKQLNSAFEQLDVKNKPFNIGVKGKTGRLWAYVWDFNTSWKTDGSSDGRVGVVPTANDLKTSFFARLPNGHPVEIKLDNVSGDAFSMAGYRDVREVFSKSPEWNFLWSIFSSEKDRDNGNFKKIPYLHPKNDNQRLEDRYYLKSNVFLQGDCDADNWGRPDPGLKTDTLIHGSFTHYFAGPNLSNEEYNKEFDSLFKPKFPSAFDNNARRCLTRLTQTPVMQFPGATPITSAFGVGKTSLEPIKLYLEKPEFANNPETRLGNVTVKIASSTSDACVFPILPNSSSPTDLKISGLGVTSGKGQLVCVKASDPKDKQVIVFPIADGVGSPSIVLSKEGKYNCYVERVERFHMTFADAEQVGSMRMYEVMPTGERVPLTLNWDDSLLDKTQTNSPSPSAKTYPFVWGVGESKDAVFGLPQTGKFSPKLANLDKKPIVSANYDSDSTSIVCAKGNGVNAQGVNARCWGNYDPNGDGTKKSGIGNADLVDTWTYYPVSDRFAFNLIAVPTSLYPIDAQYLTNGCLSSPMDVEPASGGKPAKWVPSKTPTDSDTDGIPDVVEGRPGIKVHNADSNKETELPGPNTDGDKNEDGSEKPDYKDEDTDGDGIPDKVECHFDPSHTGYGYVNGCEDTDHDGIPDYKDTDSDNDGTPDKIECVWGVDVDGWNIIEGCIVSDPANKYVPDYRNPNVSAGKPGDGDGDADGDGIPDKVENKGADPSKAASNHGGKVQPGYDKDGNVDTDNDGIPDYKDTDSDNDGIPDRIENKEDKKHKKNADGVVDSDGDGTPDYKDPDSDGDGIPDKIECFYDGNNIGTEYIEGCIVSTGDGVPDYRNPNKATASDDTDGDGIPDSVENKGADPSKAASNHGGKVQPGYDKDGNVDTDGDGTPDYKDTDSDGDGIPDKVEAGPDPTHPRKTSADPSAKPDYQNPDTDSDGDGIPDGIECPGHKDEKAPHLGPQVKGCPDTDGDGVPDYQDPDSDNDGIPDSVENKGADPSKAASKHGGKVQPGYDKDGNVDTDGDGIPDYKDTDSDGDGIPDKVEAGDHPATPTKTSKDPAAKPDYQNTDSDDDGLPDHDECHYDGNLRDGEYPLGGKTVRIKKGCIVSSGKPGDPPDYRNPNVAHTSPLEGGKGDDTDGDGIPDVTENKGADPNKKGQTGYDKNGDVDTDGDGTPDYKDTDSDGDDIPDKVECKDWDPTHVGKNYVDGCPNTDGTDQPDYRDPDSNNDGKPDKDQCKYDSTTGKCTANKDPFKKGGHRYKEPKGTPGVGVNGGLAGLGLVAGGCGCASTPDDELPGELLIVGLVGAVAITSRRRKK